MHVGEEWQWTGFGELMWGRTILILEGEIFVASVPFSYFSGGVLKGDPPWSIAQCADKVADMSRDEVVRAGGQFSLMKSGDLMMVDPGHLLFMCGLTCLPEIEPVNSNAVPGSSFLAPRPQREVQFCSLIH